MSRMRITAASCLALLAYCGSTSAREISITLTDKQSAISQFHTFDTDTMTVRRAPYASGRAIPPTGNYGISARHLVLGARQLAQADEILFQGSVDGADLVLVRREQSSYASALRMIAAARGEPVKIAAVIVFKLENGALVAQKEIVRKDSGFRWTATIAQ